ncbi:MAG: hypothetical protein JW863_20250 [Chitinispirillaceae bacterium]|nr:hypothetical protein [Chitinispirillaceae bacterium]
MKTVPSIITVCLSIVAVLPRSGVAYQIEAARPTHYFYTPTAYLNEDFDLVASLHEVSYMVPNNLQFYNSFLDNIGRVCFGARYGIFDNLSVGAGLAWSLATLGPYAHGVPHYADARFGTFLTWGFFRNEYFEGALTPHMQLGNHISAGGDVGLMGTPSPYWSVIGEFGFSYDFTDQRAYLNTVMGARIHPPQLPFLSFDGGVDFIERPPEEFAQHFRPFIDAIFTMKTIQ